MSSREVLRRRGVRSWRAYRVRRALVAALKGALVAAIALVLMLAVVVIVAELTPGAEPRELQLRDESQRMQPPIIEVNPLWDAERMERALLREFDKEKP